MSLFRGIECFMSGASTAFSKQVRPFVIVPATVSLIVVVSGLALGFSYVTDLSNYLISALPSWLDFLQWILQPLLYLLGLLVGAWSFGFIATIIGSPFLGDLSSRVEQVVPPERSWWQQVAPALAREFRKLRYHLPRLLLLLLVSIVPVVNAIAPFLWLGFGAWMMAVQFCDYSTENRNQEFSATLSILQNNRAGALGFGACVTLAMSIPILNVIVAPIAVCGGTMLMQRFRQNPQ